MRLGRMRREAVRLNSRNWLFAPILFGAVLLIAACDEGEGADAEPAVPRIEVTVTDSGIDPLSVELQPPDVHQLVVHNESSEECSFNLGDYVRDLVVPAG